MEATHKREAPARGRAAVRGTDGRAAWIGRGAQRWLLRTLGLLIVLELGLLTPLTCVFHCFLEARAERPAIGWFLCGVHHTSAAAVAGADASTPVVPRAFFELLGPSLLLLPLAGAPVPALILRATRRHDSLPLPPPTPPPRPVSC
ncbi:MAG: hypothetical protein SNJ69_01915 [Chloroflexaceae bacterium]